MRALLALAFPPVCVHCGGLIEGGPCRALCAGCAAEVERVSFPAVVRFDGAVRSLILALKFRGKKEVLPDLCAMLASSAELMSRARGAAIVPVPADPVRERERGFNQAALLARALADAAGDGAHVRACLRRQGTGAAQSSLRREHRAANVKNAFALAGRPELNVASRHLIIDDVTTTGSTLESCAHVLRAAGCRHVDAAALAQG